MSKDIPDYITRRRIIQWCLLPIVIITIGLGWKYPLLGLSVPIVMLTAMTGGFIRGRYVCGNLCPRGSFLDRIGSRISPGKTIPNGFRNMYFRWTVFALMMTFMIFRISKNPTDIYHWGKVFWLMCVITTGIALVLALFIHQRTWCSFCPIGTVQNASGGRKKNLLIDKDLCIDCKKCEKVCPINLQIVVHKESGVMSDPDCIKCSECIAVCPKKALSWPSGKQNK